MLHGYGLPVCVLSGIIMVTFGITGVIDNVALLWQDHSTDSCWDARPGDHRPTVLYASVAVNVWSAIMGLALLAGASCDFREHAEAVVTAGHNEHELTLANTVSGAIGCVVGLACWSGCVALVDVFRHDVHTSPEDCWTAPSARWYLLSQSLGLFILLVVAGSLTAGSWVFVGTLTYQGLLSVRDLYYILSRRPVENIIDNPPYV